MPPIPTQPWGTAPPAEPSPRFVPWHVPAWVPRELEGSLTFAVGVGLGVAVAFLASGMISFFAVSPIR